MTIDIKVPTPIQTIINLASKKQEELRDVSIQASTGKKHQDFQSLAADANVERFVSLSATLKSTETYEKSNDIILARTQKMEQTLEQMIELADEAKEIITQRNNGATGQNVPVDALAPSFIERLESFLNTRFDGRYIFAGTKTDTKPVQNLNTSNVDSATLTTTSNYYRGNSDIVSINISQSEELSYGITANNSAFQKLAGSIHLLMEGHDSDDLDIIGDSFTMIDEALNEIISLRANTNAASTTISNATIVHRSVNKLAFENFSDVANVDVPTAQTRMIELEAIIQSSYLAFNRLSGLRLSNFLN
jgi:flagellar hook-associated protein 3 FlgL